MSFANTTRHPCRSIARRTKPIPAKNSAALNERDDFARRGIVISVFNIRKGFLDGLIITQETTRANRFGIHRLRVFGMAISRRKRISFIDGETAIILEGSASLKLLE